MEQLALRYTLIPNSASLLLAVREYWMRAWVIITSHDHKLGDASVGDGEWLIGCVIYSIATLGDGKLLQVKKSPKNIKRKKKEKQDPAGD